MGRYRRHLQLLLGLLLTLILVGADPGIRLAYATGTYDGVVFQDFNGNGIQDLTSTAPASGAGTYDVAVDNPVQGVTVTLYDNTGASVTGITDVNGAYSLDSSPLAAGPYRLEFSGYEALGYSSTAQGADSDTSVQFVLDGGATLNFGVNIGTDYCQNNPDLVTSCFVFGDQQGGTNSNLPVFISFPYSAGGIVGSTAAEVGDPTTHNISVPADEMGSTFGAVYDRVEQQIYASAYMKRHSGFGADGPGAIYRIDASTGSAATATLYFDMNVLAGNPAGTDYRGTPHDFDTDGDNVGWDSVGKLSLGGMASDPAGEFVYVMALNNRTLYRLPLDAGLGSAAIQASAISSAVPLTGCATADDVRPFAVTYNVFQGTPSLYVGVICTGESSYPGAPAATGSVGDRSLLRALVYEVNPTTLAFNGTPVLNVPLNYPRGNANDIGGQTANWQTWSPEFRSLSASPFIVYAQPLLSQITFDNGDMILGIRDRLGDQVGRLSLSDPSSATRVSGISGGDTLRACGDPGSGWTLENGGLCGGNGPGVPAANPRPQGPGNAEFYAGDEFEPYFSSGGTPPGQSGDARHDELSLGGVFQLPGFPDVAITMFDPAYIDSPDQYNTGGVRWLNDVTGLVDRTYRIYSTPGGTPPPQFGKANGLGGLVALCDAAPIEIGNYVWFDLNNDGIQNPGETPLAGIEVELFDPDTNTVIATAITDANGNYYFSSGGGTDTASALYNLPLDFGENYEVRIDLTQAAITTGNYLVAPANTGEGGQPDLNDSDGVMSGNYSSVSFNTGDPGDNDHSFDFGFIQSAPLSLGNRVWFDTNNNGNIDGGESGVDGVEVQLFVDTNRDGIPDTPGTPFATTTTANNGYYLFDNLPPGDYVVFIPPSNFGGGGPLENYLSSTPTEASPDANVDSNDNGLNDPSPATNGILSGPVNLQVGDEPDSETDLGVLGDGSAAPDSSNLTVDFGFVQSLPLSLGNRVWFDTNNNGLIDGGESGIDGVEVQLFLDANQDGIADTPATPVATQTTANNGYYLFDNLAPGSYVVYIPPSNFGVGAPLENLFSSTPTEASPNSNGDSNDNGLNDPNPAVNGTWSGTVTLDIGTEPTTEADLGPAGDGSAAPSESNLTVDFGFNTVTPPPGIPPSPGSDAGNPSGPDILVFDPAVSKIGILQDNGVGLVGERLEWIVTVRNQGNAPGINVQITDVISDDSRIESVIYGGPYQVNGQTVTVTIPRLDPGQSIQFSIVVTILRSPFDHDNEVLLSAPGIDQTTVGYLVSELPSTGETPWWRDTLVAVVLGLMVSATAYWLTMRRQPR